MTADLNWLAHVHSRAAAAFLPRPKFAASMESVSTEYTFAPIYEGYSLELCGLEVALQSGLASGGVAESALAVYRRRLTLLFDEIVDLLGMSLATSLLDAGYFLRLRIDRRLLLDQGWTEALCELQCEEGADLAIQILVEGVPQDVGDERLARHVALLRSVNVRVIVELARGDTALDIDALAHTGIAGLAGEVDTLCSVTVGAHGKRALGDDDLRRPLLSLSAQNVRSAREFDVARALRCGFLSGPLLGAPVDTPQARQFVRVSVWGRAGGVR